MHLLMYNFEKRLFNNYLNLWLIVLCLVLVSGHVVNAQDALKAPIVFIKATGDWEETGTGFLVGQENNQLYLFTAAHVIENATDIQLEFYQGPQQVKAEVVQINEGLDLAAIKCLIPKGFTPPASFAAAKAEERIRQAVIVVGHPAGSRWDINYNSNVKTTDYDLDDRRHTLDPMGIAPGSSGGPVLTLQYELMGLVGENNAVRAVCVDVATIVKACESWDIPVNLLSGITIEKPVDNPGDDDFRYRLFVQEANTAFAAGKWEQAKRAFEEADAMISSEAFQAKIQQCEVEMARDKAYEQHLALGKAAITLETALSHFQQAQQQRNTEEVRRLIQQVKEKITGPGISTPLPSELPQEYDDPFAGKMILVEGGVFTMGCDTCAEEDQWPAHQVNLDHYYIGADKVKVKQFCQYLNADRPTLESFSIDIGGIQVEKKGKIFVYTPEPEAADQPVHVDYCQMRDYCWWLGSKTGHEYRLPTEAEWEYAASGGRKSKAYVYAGSNDEETLRRNKIPNELGLFGMSNGSSELCSDWYDAAYYERCKKEGTVFNPNGPPDTGEGRVTRGGGGSANTIKTRMHDGYIPSYSFRLVREPYGIYSGREIATDFFEKDMVLVEGGSFIRVGKGNLSEGPGHEVFLENFYISSLEVTEEQWYAVMEMEGSYLRCPEEGNASRAISASWIDVDTFLLKLNVLTGMNYRLPTEAEWEYAARGGKKGMSKNNIYSGSNDLDAVAWITFEKIFRRNAAHREDAPHHVGQKKPNALGLYDMSGNVLEWCNDWWAQDYYHNSPKENPLGPALSPYKVVRGKDTVAVRFGSRPHLAELIPDPLYSFGSPIGFRLARSLSGDPLKPEFKDPFEGDLIPIKGGTVEVKVRDIRGNDQSYQEGIGSFKMAAHEVTESQWKQVMGYQPDPKTYCPECPAAGVTLDQVRMFINTLNQATGKKYRLPYEAEWIWAAQGGKSKKHLRWAGTDNEKELYLFANYCDKNCTGKYKREGAYKKDDGYPGLAPVGSFRPNALGLFDMTGNVEELCHTPGDDPAEDYDFPYLVAKGGSYQVYSTYIGIHRRFRFDSVVKTTGFRLVEEL